MEVITSANLDDLLARLRVGGDGDGGRKLGGGVSWIGGVLVVRSSDVGEGGKKKSNGRGLQMMNGKTLRVLRVMKGMSVDQLAAATGFSSSYISKIERGQKRFPLKYVYRFIDTLGVDIDDVLGVQRAIEKMQSKSKKEDRLNTQTIVL